jgi:endogenous inhibitor of DNA gyrase (YacG/DUF329 family)
MKMATGGGLSEKSSSATPQSGKPSPWERKNHGCDVSRLTRPAPVSRFETRCEECGEEVDYSRTRRTSRRLFCSDKCRYRARDRRRYEADPEGQRERSRRYYAEHRDEVLAKAAERRGTVPRVPGGLCVECGEQMTGRANRVVCSKRCADRRYRRLHPMEYKAKQARKYERRKAAKRRPRP